MFIVCKRNVRIPSNDGAVTHAIPRDYVGPVPDWVAETAYFKALVADGKIAVSENTQDKSVQKAAEKPVKKSSTKKEV